MKLYEFEGHRILKKVGIESPFFVVCSDLDEVRQARKRLKFPIVVKVQVLSGRRGKSGGVKTVKNEKDLVATCKEFFESSFGGGKVIYLGLFEKVDIKSEYYISITYDTILRCPFLLYSPDGGMEIEEVKKKSPEKIIRVDIDPLVGLRAKDLKKLSGDLVDFSSRLWDAFWRYDLRLLEINPLAVDDNNKLWTVDAKVIVDDAGLVRHKDFNLLPKGAIGAIPTNRELLAREIDSSDYRGAAGSTFIEFDGDIAILASGGGASLLVMDSLVLAGGKPANYTEYSGNPPAEKVEKLTKIVLSREGLSGCLLCGAVANFTDIYETLRGFVEGLRQVKPKPDYPIVVRRGGPRQEEAYVMLEKVGREEGFDFHLFGPQTPISVACRKMVEFLNEFKNQKSNIKNTD